MKITERALRKIETTIAGIDDPNEFGDFVPVIVWIYNRSDADDNPGPSLGLLDRSQANIESMEHFTDGKVTVYNGLPDDLRQKYQTSVLDFIDNNFEFVDGA
ncbi:MULTISPECIES: hypothetical protein [unclassified Bradyrhizobium]|uniref:hypothetical protein n=1 Tax=unclassified Bradyrhizobium TaxID=2631580 RepID=UPI0028EDED87|nr:MULTISPECIES: hypothetical protein [unclassified Bradyrhizobium]